LVATVLVLMHSASVANAQVVSDNYIVPTANSRPHGIVAGPDGNLWFAEFSGNKIGRVSTSGVFAEFPLPHLNSGPESIVQGPDGALWFTEQLGNRIGRITTAGAITEFDIPTPESMPHGLTTGPDGAIWFTERAVNKIGRLALNGLFTEFPLRAGLGPEPDLIIQAADGNLWFGERNGGKIGRINPRTGVIDEFIPPTQLVAGEMTYTHGIAAGPDEAIWFTEQRADKIGRVNLAGFVTDEVPLPSTGNMPHAILPGPDGALWFTEQKTNKIGRISVDTHQIAEFNVPTPKSMPYQLALGPDGALWFTEQDENRIGFVVPFATGGSFVIGDRDAVVGHSVTFWGAQWSNATHLSAGPAPDSFKGFENGTALPACGRTWTGARGNAAQPPNSVAPLMSVIVSSAIKRSAAGIAGDVRAIAVINTHPGYGPNPGHAGTGRVVAVVPCQ
jgi:virginiamycin B lyase